MKRLTNAELQNLTEDELFSSFSYFLSEDRLMIFKPMKIKYNNSRYLYTMCRIDRNDNVLYVNNFTELKELSKALKYDDESSMIKFDDITDYALYLAKKLSKVKLFKEI